MSTRAPTGSPTQEGWRSRVRGAPASYGLIAAFVAVFLAAGLDPDERLFAAFAKVDDRVRAGEVWRLFTASFLHAGVLHLWFNATALAAIGPAVERVYGKAQLVAAFLLGGAAGMLASVAFTPAPSVGASAGVFALLGVLLAYAVRGGSTLAPQARRYLVRQVLFVVALNVGIGLLARFIDNAAHLGGLAGGFALGLVLRPREPLFPGTGTPSPRPSPPARAGGEGA